MPNKTQMFLLLEKNTFCPQIKNSNYAASSSSNKNSFRVPNSRYCFSYSGENSGSNW